MCFVYEVILSVRKEMKYAALLVLLCAVGVAVCDSVCVASAYRSVVHIVTYINPGMYYVRGRSVSQYCR